MNFHIKIFVCVRQAKNTFLAFCADTNHFLAVKSILGDLAIWQNANQFFYEKLDNLPPRPFIYF